jgi:outer membrane protein OmpA-like peptidoglycan-associated protein
LSDGKTLDIDSNSPAADVAQTLADSAAPLPRRFRFDDLRFGSRSATLSQGATKTIDDLAATLRAYPSSHVRVDGYTDGVGDGDANQKLSEERARAIKEALISKGIAGSRIETMGSGPRRHVASDDSNRGRTLNRRSEVVLLNR